MLPLVRTEAGHRDTGHVREGEIEEDKGDGEWKGSDVAKGYIRKWGPHSPGQGRDETNIMVGYIMVMCSVTGTSTDTVSSLVSSSLGNSS